MVFKNLLLFFLNEFLCGFLERGDLGDGGLFFLFQNFFHFVLKQMNL